MQNPTHAPPVEPDQEQPDVATCVVCGCTDERACESGCYWITAGVMADVCSSCAPGPAALEAALRARLADEIDQAIKRSERSFPDLEAMGTRRLGMRAAQRIVAPTPEQVLVPLPVEWDGIVMGPSGDTENENTLVPCSAPGLYPVALVLDDVARLSLGQHLLATLGYAAACTTPGCGTSDREEVPLHANGWLFIREYDDPHGAWWCSPGCAYGAVTAGTSHIHYGSHAEYLDDTYGPGAGDEYAAQQAEAAEAALDAGRLDGPLDWDQDEDEAGDES